MSAVEKLRQIQDTNKSIICLGLDLDPRRMPPEYAKSIKGMYDFVMEIVEATKDMVCAYKPNLAFYENKGAEGLSLLASITHHIPEDIVIILDGKRGDIGNTASFYAEALYRKWNADWVTLSPYMGYDAMRPFLEYEDKGSFVLCLTSNTGSKDFQHLMVGDKPLYQIVAEKVAYWNKDNNLGLVVGATQPEHLKNLRDLAGQMPFLIPGVGAQGGSLEKAAVYGTDNFQKIAVINVCRSVLYASSGADFALRAREELQKLNDIVTGLRTGEIKLETNQPVFDRPSDQPQAGVESKPESEPPAQEDKPSESPQEAEPPKKEWKLPPIPDLPFMRKSTPPPDSEDKQSPNQAADSRREDDDRRDKGGDRGDQQGGGPDQRQHQDFRRRHGDNRNFRDRNFRNNRHRRDNRNKPFNREGGNS